MRVFVLAAVLVFASTLFGASEHGGMSKQDAQIVGRIICGAEPIFRSSLEDHDQMIVGYVILCDRDPRPLSAILWQRGKKVEVQTVYRESWRKIPAAMGRMKYLEPDGKVWQAWIRQVTTLKDLSAEEDQ